MGTRCTLTESNPSAVLPETLCRSRTGGFLVCCWDEPSASNLNLTLSYDHSYAIRLLSVVNNPKASPIGELLLS